MPIRRLAALTILAASTLVLSGCVVHHKPHPHHPHVHKKKVVKPKVNVHVHKHKHR